MPGKIHFLVGDATQPLGHGQKIIVHICNDIGGWGRGFVAALSRRWKEPELNYRAWHQGKGDIPFELGQVQFVPVTADLIVANLIGQRDIKRSKDQSKSSLPPIRYEAVRKGLKSIALRANQLQASIHMPRIGCGLAGGNWEEIQKIVEEELSAKDIEVYVYDLPHKLADKSAQIAH